MCVVKYQAQKVLDHVKETNLDGRCDTAEMAAI